MPFSDSQSSPPRSVTWKGELNILTIFFILRCADFIVLRRKEALQCSRYSHTDHSFSHHHIQRWISKPDQYSLRSPFSASPLGIYSQTRHYPLQSVNHVQTRTFQSRHLARIPLPSFSPPSPPHLEGLRNQSLGILSLQIPISNKRRDVHISLVLHALARLAEPRGDGSGKDLEGLDDAVDVVVVWKPKLLFFVISTLSPLHHYLPK